MIHLSHGDILKHEADALVNTVNCMGVMGRGIALQFRNAFEDNYEAYRKAAKRQEIVPAGCSSSSGPPSSGPGGSSTSRQSGTGRGAAGSRISNPGWWTWSGSSRRRASGPSPSRPWVAAWGDWIGPWSVP